MTEDIELYKRVRRGKKLYHAEKRRERRDSFKNWFERNDKTIRKYLISLFLWGVIIGGSLSIYAPVSRYRDIESFYKTRELTNIYDIFTFLDCSFNYTTNADNTTVTKVGITPAQCVPSQERTEDYAKYSIKFDFSASFANQILNSWYTLYFTWSVPYYFNNLLQEQAVREFYIEAKLFNANYIRYISLYTGEIIIEWAHIRSYTLDSKISPSDEIIQFIEPKGFYSEITIVFEYFNLKELRK